MPGDRIALWLGFKRTDLWGGQLLVEQDLVQVVPRSDVDVHAEVGQVDVTAGCDRLS